MTASHLFGFFSSWIIYGVILALHLILPARWVDGYVRNPATGKPLRYRLNGLLVLFVLLGIYGALGSTHVIPWDFLYVERWMGLMGALTLGLLATGLIVFTAKPTGKGLLADTYLGRLENPQWGGGRLDAKMLLYLVGAALLELNLVSFAAHHALLYPGHVSPGVLLYLGLFSFFIVEYLFFEFVHLYTYDFFAERVGFKLTWGCMVFYPYFYAVGLWSAAPLTDPGRPAVYYVGCALVFFTGWSFARGANMQKWLYKTRPDARFLGVLAPETVTDGKNRLLVNGFWGLSRHVNYLGEILMATGLALALGRPDQFWPWLYPIYYLALLIPRQIDDDKRCAAKYGPLWQTYVARVKWRILPGIY